MLLLFWQVVIALCMHEPWSMIHSTGNLIFYIFLFFLILIHLNWFLRNCLHDHLITIIMWKNKIMLTVTIEKIKADQSGLCVFHFKNIQCARMKWKMKQIESYYDIIYYNTPHSPFTIVHIFHLVRFIFVSFALHSFILSFSQWFYHCYSYRHFI